MLTSFPYDYPRSNIKKRSLGLDSEPQWIKRTKQKHSASTVSLAQPILSIPFQSAMQQQQQSLPLATLPGNSKTNDTVIKNSVDEMMVDDMGSSYSSERIDDMEKYLNDDEDGAMEDSDTTDGQYPIDIYTLLERHHRPLTATMVNGVLLPMERQHGGTKHCIPEFVLRSPKSTTCSSRSNLETHLKYRSLDQAQQTFSFGNADSMDID
ncbi:hypothetical protein BCR42DRAFT_445638 [Absidia repens]|uniref:Uncharacterized protein n=1 Tax=Absidia repens TaxID=90262 RepID=A0A1X2J254_9FUNG|nr:hypothetical protein BCR42DRAFT_445638 [Absidia repens]